MLLQQHQVAMLKACEGEASVLICSKTGSGKTRVALAACRGQRTLYLAPTHVVPHVCREALKCDMDMQSIDVMSYRAFGAARHIGNYDTLVMDEVHTVVNRSRLCTKLRALNVLRRVGISATVDSRRVARVLRTRGKKSRIAIACVQPEAEQLPAVEKEVWYVTINREQRAAYDAIVAADDVPAARSLADSIKLGRCRRFLASIKLDILFDKLTSPWGGDATGRKCVAVVASDNRVAMELAMRNYGMQDVAICMTVDEARSNVREGRTLLVLAPAQVRVGVDLDMVDVLIVMEPCYTRVQEQQLIGRLSRLSDGGGSKRRRRMVVMAVRDTCDERMMMDIGQTPPHVREALAVVAATPSQ